MTACTAAIVHVAVTAHADGLRLAAFCLQVRLSFLGEEDHKRGVRLRAVEDDTLRVAKLLPPRDGRLLDRGAAASRMVPVRGPPQPMTAGLHLQRATNGNALLRSEGPMFVLHAVTLS